MIQLNHCPSKCQLINLWLDYTLSLEPLTLISSLSLLPFFLSEQNQTQKQKFFLIDHFSASQAQNEKKNFARKQVLKINEKG